MRQRLPGLSFVHLSELQDRVLLVHRIETATAVNE